MKVATQDHTSASNFLYFSFNQECTAFAVGSDLGFFVCDTSPLRERWRRGILFLTDTDLAEFDDGGIGIVEMLHKSNIVALVGGGTHPKFAKNKVVIWDDIQFQAIAELAFQSEVKAVKLRKDRIMVALEGRVYVYDFANLNLIDQLDTCSNPTGLCAISSSPNDIIYACLGEKVGEVRITSPYKNHTITAHATQITQMTLNPSGNRLATSSEKGTIIRVFDTFTGVKTAEFRRGTQPAVIQSLAFNYNATMLCASSSTGTIHVYSCGQVQLDNKTSTFSVLKGWVPLAGDIWSAKQIYIPDTQSIGVFGPDEGNNHVIFGNFYKYTFNDYIAEAVLEAVAALTVHKHR